MTQESRSAETSTGGCTELPVTAIIALAVSGVIYYCYYLLAPWIWNQNIPYNPEDITPWITGPAQEHDGVEIYALYIMVFVNSTTAFILSCFVRQISRTSVRRSIVILSAVVSCIYCATIGFIPPMNSFHGTPLNDTILKSLSIMAVVIPLGTLINYLNNHFPRWSPALVALALTPVCFVSTAPISMLDYAYIFSPAMRLLNGAAIRDIYFQYDLLPSLLAAAWMNLGFDLNTFQILGQAAYFIIIVGVFIFSEKLFLKKGLSVLLLVALVLGRIYASPWDAVLCFQVTPLRLDLWFPLLVVVFLRGPFHWSAGLACGLLLLLLKNFGIIYTLAYFQLLITLFAIRYSDGNRKTSFSHALLEYGRHCAKPLAIILCCVVASYFLFRNDEYPNYSGYYQKIGIGFIKIATDSFYWYVPAMISMVLILLFRLRNSISSTYLTSGFLLTYCAIGNSIYFFGRSHEHNILNISIVLLFLFFFLLDLISILLNERVDDNASFSLFRRHGAVCVAFLAIIVITVSYSQNIAGKAITQIINCSQGQLIYPAKFSAHYYANYLTTVKMITNNSRKVYFIDGSDFMLYYHGGYEPVGFCNPFQTWIFTRDLNRFLQGLLDNGYYLVCNSELKQLLSNLQYTIVKELGQNVVVTKVNQQAPQP